jgi:hypothetical protein
MDLEIKVRCRECNQELEIQGTTLKAKGNHLIIATRGCQTCLDNALNTLGTDEILSEIDRRKEISRQKPAS